MHPLKPHSALAVVYRTVVYVAVMAVLVALAAFYVTDGFQNYSHWTGLTNWQKAGEAPVAPKN